MKLRKSFKLSLIFFIAAVVSTLLHNLISGLIEKEEPVFFILTFVFLFATIISVLLGIIKSFTNKKASSPDKISDLEKDKK